MTGKTLQVKTRKIAEGMTVLMNTPTKNHHKLPIAEIEVGPLEQPHMSLGRFTAANPPIGFSIEVTPETDSEMIVTRVATLGSDDDYDYELILHIANFSNRAVSAEVRRL